MRSEVSQYQVALVAQYLEVRFGARGELCFFWRKECLRLREHCVGLRVIKPTDLSGLGFTWKIF